jgi:hypothetical protein
MTPAQTREKTATPRPSVTETQSRVFSLTADYWPSLRWRATFPSGFSRFPSPSAPAAASFPAADSIAVIATRAAASLPPPPTANFADSAAIRAICVSLSTGDAAVRPVFPAGLIAGVVIGVLVLNAAGIGLVCVLRRGRHRQKSGFGKSDSADLARDIDFADSTLRTTIVTSPTMHAIEDAMPDSGVSLWSDFPPSISTVP